MKKIPSYKKALVKFIEKELILVLAIVVMLGILIGYSLAAALRAVPDLTQPGTGTSLMRIEAEEGETN